MDKKSTYMTLAAIVLLGGAFVYWRSQVKQEPTAHVVLVTDTSSSVLKNCNAWAETVRKSLTGLNITEDSRFGLIHTGSVAKSSMAAGLAMDTPIPIDSTFGGSAEGGQTRGQFLAAIKTTCEGLPVADGSAVFRSVKMGLEHLRGLGCAGPSSCRLVIMGDLDENIDSEIAKRVHKGAPGPADKPVLENSFTYTELCGWEQITGGTLQRTDTQAIVDGFAGLFTVPPVRRPYCDGAASQAAVR